MSNSIIITLPLPEKELHPNRRIGRSRLASIIRSKKVKKARDDGLLASRFLLPKDAPWNAADMQLHFYLPRKNDDDNLVAWTKAYRDGIADSGIVANDSRFTLLPVIQTTGRDLDHRLEITIFKRN